MTPEELVRKVEALADAGAVRMVAQRGAGKALSGTKVRGHRLQYRDGLLRVQGPAAPQVARVLSERMGEGAQRAVRENLS